MNGTLEEQLIQQRMLIIQMDQHFSKQIFNLNDRIEKRRAQLGANAPKANPKSQTDTGDLNTLLGKSHNKKQTGSEGRVNITDILPRPKKTISLPSLKDQ